MHHSREASYDWFATWLFACPHLQYSNSLQTHWIPGLISFILHISSPLLFIFWTYWFLPSIFLVSYQGETKTVCDASWPTFSPYNKLVRKVRARRIKLFSRLTTNSFLSTLEISHFTRQSYDFTEISNINRLIFFTTFFFLGIYFLPRLFEKHSSGVFENKITFSWW